MTEQRRLVAVVAAAANVRRPEATHRFSKFFPQRDTLLASENEAAADTFRTQRTSASTPTNVCVYGRVWLQPTLAVPLQVPSPTCALM